MDHQHTCLSRIEGISISGNIVVSKRGADVDDNAEEGIVLIQTAATKAAGTQGDKMANTVVDCWLSDCTVTGTIKNTRFSIKIELYPTD